MAEEYSDATKQAIATVASSTMRQRALEALDDGVGIVAEIADRAEMTPTPTSRALKDLREVGAAEDMRDGTAGPRPHRITERGEIVLDVVCDE
jgi:DNA-binding transcriptional ArsR family regulator